MIDLDAANSALSMLFSSWQIWAVLVPGLLIGLTAGAVIGVQNPMAMAICLPLTLYMDFLPAVMLLTAIFTGAGFGGAITSILMGIPGTSSCVATTFDGYPMAQQGKHNEALGVALLSSCFGVLFGYMLLFLLIVPLSRWVLKLGPVEMLFVALWGLSTLAALGGKYMSRGLIAAIFGVLMGTVGMNTSGYLRGTAGISFLLEGVPFVPAMMGLFAASQLFELVGKKFLVQDESLRRADFGKIMGSIRWLKNYPFLLLRGSLIGTFIGAIPGIGSSLANLVSYSETKRMDRDPDSFGKGNPKGVAASESANSSSEGGSMVIMLALGIPGGAGTAMLLVAFGLHNVIGGPQFISNNMDIVYVIIFGNFVQAGLLLVVGLLFISVAGNIVKLPLPILIPSVLVLSVVGSYAVTGDIAGPITLFAFAVFGWVMKRYEYPIAATVVGLVLGRMVESELIRSYQLSAGDVLFLLERPVGMVFAALLILSLFQPLILKAFRFKWNPSTGD